jgi:hypothetical protein
MLFTIIHVLLAVLGQYARTSGIRTLPQHSVSCIRTSGHSIPTVARGSSPFVHMPLTSRSSSYPAYSHYDICIPLLVVTPHDWPPGPARHACSPHWRCKTAQHKQYTASSCLLCGASRDTGLYQTKQVGARANAHSDSCWFSCRKLVTSHKLQSWLQLFTCAQNTPTAYSRQLCVQSHQESNAYLYDCFRGHALHTTVSIAR